VNNPWLEMQIHQRIRFDIIYLATSCGAFDCDSEKVAEKYLVDNGWKSIKSMSNTGKLVVTTYLGMPLRFSYGVPDFFVYKPDFKEVFFAEVKSNSFGMDFRASQLTWLDHARLADIPTIIIAVEYWSDQEIKSIFSIKSWDKNQVFRIPDDYIIAKQIPKVKK
jgi:hypothetical protein